MRLRPAPIVALLTFLQVGVGCSFVMTRPPSVDSPAAISTCSTSRVPATIDILVAVALGIVGSGLIVQGGIPYLIRSDTARSWDPYAEERKAAWLVVPGALLFAGAFPLVYSSRYGERNARECQRLQFETPMFGSSPNR